MGKPGFPIPSPGGRVWKGLPLKQGDGETGFSPSPSLRRGAGKAKPSRPLIGYAGYPDRLLMHAAADDEATEIELLVAELAGRIGPRRPTSAEEARAAAFVNGRLRRAGMGVSAYELRVVPRAGTTYALFAALGMAGAALAFFFPWLGLLWGLGLLAIALADAFVAPLPPLGPCRVSQNIVGTRAIAEAAGAPPLQPRWRVVVLAPLDTPPLQHGLAVLAGSGRSAALARLAAATLLVAGALGALLLPGPWWLLQGGAGLLFGLILIGAIRPLTPDPSDGGCAALAALVSAVTRLGALERAEVWAVAVGAASSDPWGGSACCGATPSSQSAPWSSPWSRSARASSSTLPLRGRSAAGMPTPCLCAWPPLPTPPIRILTRTPAISPQKASSPRRSAAWGTGPSP